MATRIGQIITALRKTKGVRQSDLAEMSGLKQPNISRIENGLVKKPRHSTLVRIAEALGVEVEKLLDESTWANLGLPHRRSGQPDARTNLGETVSLQMVPLFATGAGGQVDFGDGDYPVGQSDEYIQIPTTARTCFATRIVGNSMESRDGADSFREGDIVIFAEHEVRPGDYAFVRTPSSSTFKQIFFDRSDAVRLVPLNRAYEERTVPRSEIVQMWRMVQHVKDYS